MAQVLPVVIVTGLSGAGKSSALGALEDLGYEVIENLPMDLIEATVEQAPAGEKGLAINVDSRSRGFSSDGLAAATDRLRARPDTAVRLLFLTCGDTELARRYTETRRRHPLADGRPVLDGVALERRLLAKALDAADEVVDTSLLNIHQLKHLIGQRFSIAGEKRLSVVATSFSFKHGIPREADLLFDVRFLANPHWDPLLRPKTGCDAAVGAYISEDPRFPEFWERVSGLLRFLVPLYEREGKAHLTIAFGCTGGRHRSVFMTEQIAKLLRGDGHRVTVLHRDMEFA